MEKFENYKNAGRSNPGKKFYYMIFNSRIKRTVFNSVCAFIAGLFLTLAGLYIYDKKNIPKGVGGLETSGVPEFRESDFDSGLSKSKSTDNSSLKSSLENSIAGSSENADKAAISSISAAVKTSHDSSDSGLLENHNQAFHGDFEADSPENAEALLEHELNEASSMDGLADGLGSDALTGESSYDDNLELCYSTYRVKKGDMIGYIADSFNITQDTIISVNNIRQSRLLQIGQYLKIPSMPGIIYTVRKNGETIESIAKKYDISPEKASRINNVENLASLNAGTTLFLPDAYLDWVTRQEINGDLFHKPIRARYWLSSYYGWRSSPFNGKRSYHSGVDMACPQGTNVYAALVGTVTSTGFNNVYGNYVIVTHHSGYKTLYGHLSAILVTRGKVVDTNTRIGKVGSTGMSTGPHLHFTVYKNGKTVDPMALWK